MTTTEPQKPEIRPEFRANLLNAEGFQRVASIRQRFSGLLTDLEALCPQGREFSLVKTHLETACLFAARSVAIAHPGTEQPGTESDLNAIIDRYDMHTTETRNVLRELGIPEAQEGRALATAERVLLLAELLCGATPETIREGAPVDWARKLGALIKQDLAAK